MAKKKKKSRGKNRQPTPGKWAPRLQVPPVNLVRSQTDGDDNRPNTETNAEREIQPKQQLGRRHHMRPRMETIAVVIGVVGVVLGLLAGGLFSVDGHRDQGVWVTCAAIVLAVIGGFVWWQDRLWKQDEEAKPAGVLVDPGGRTDNFGPMVYLDVGTNKLFPKTLPAAVVVHNGDAMVTLGDGNGGLWVSAKFFDSSGKIVCQIEENKIVILDKTKFFRVDQRAHGLAVFDDEAQKVFEIERRIGGEVRIRGTWWLKNGVRLAAGDDGLRIGNGAPMRGNVAHGGSLEIVTQGTPPNTKVLGAGI